MFLFLDVASPIPEFHIIKDKKIVDSIKIIEDADKKLSDEIIPKYLEINNTYNLSKEISHLILSIGPGSYTALRVGASFVAGLSQSMNIPIAIISSETICDYLYKAEKKIAVYFESSNDQKFFTFKKDKNYYHYKITNDDFSIPKNISFIFYNFNLPKFINNKIDMEIFSYKKIILKNFDKLTFKKNFIIKPIYISNNSILN